MFGGWALWQWIDAVLGDGEMPVVVRLSIVAIAVGLLVLLLSVVRERLFLHRSDPYSREVTR